MSPHTYGDIPDDIPTKPYTPLAKYIWMLHREYGYELQRKMITDSRPLIEINQQALSLLYRELGVVDTVRFLKQFTQGYGNYTQEREVLFADKSLDDIVNEIERRRKTAQ